MKSLAGVSKNKFQHMYAKMDLNIIRYEMFLREVAPQWLHEDFLDCFMMLPNSYYAPKAKEMFEDFIKRYGTHYVHAHLVSDQVPQHAAILGAKASCLVSSKTGEGIQVVLQLS